MAIPFLRISHSVVLLLFVLVIMATACRSKHMYQQYRSTDVEGWNSTDTLTYTVPVPKAGKGHPFSLSVRHTKAYEFSNLWLKLRVTSKGLDTSFRYEVPLFRKDGKPFGRTSGSLCTQTVPVKTILPLTDSTTYQLQIIHLMRKDPLDGVSDIGILIE